MTFMVWFDPDKKTEPTQKVRDACDCYEAKFNQPASLCLTSHVDAAALIGADLPVDVRGVTYVQRNTFYIGQEETA